MKGILAFISMAIIFSSCSKKIDLDGKGYQLMYNDVYHEVIFQDGVHCSFDISVSTPFFTFYDIQGSSLYFYSINDSTLVKSYEILFIADTLVLISDEIEHKLIPLQIDSIVPFKEGSDELDFENWYFFEALKRKLRLTD